MSLNHSEDYYLRMLFEKTMIQEIMVKPVISIKVNEKLSEALNVFSQHHISHLVVVDDHDRVEGGFNP